MTPISFPMNRIGYWSLSALIFCMTAISSLSYAEADLSRLAIAGTTFVFAGDALQIIRDSECGYLLKPATAQELRRRAEVIATFPQDKQSEITAAFSSPRFKAKVDEYVKSFQSLGDSFKAKNWSQETVCGAMIGYAIHGAVRAANEWESAKAIFIHRNN